MSRLYVGNAGAKDRPRVVDLSQMEHTEKEDEWTGRRTEEELRGYRRRNAFRSRVARTVLPSGYKRLVVISGCTFLNIRQWGFMGRISRPKHQIFPGSPTRKRPSILGGYVPHSRHIYIPRSLHNTNRPVRVATLVEARRAGLVRHPSERAKV